MSTIEGLLSMLLVSHAFFVKLHVSTIEPWGPLIEGWL